MKKIILLLPCLMVTLLFSTPLTKMDLIKHAQKEVGEMTPKKLKTLLDEGEEIVVLDVRESVQRSEGSIPPDEFNSENFIALTRGNLEWKIEKKVPNKNTLIVSYCRNGGRGALASEILKKMGYIHATTLKGGLKGWAKAGYPIKTGLGITVLKIK
jgi:rhodanese-related sulfurtransferase